MGNFAVKVNLSFHCFLFCMLARLLCSFLITLLITLITLLIMIIGGNQYNLFSSAWFKKGIITLKDFLDETGATQTMKTNQKAELKQ